MAHVLAVTEIVLIWLRFLSWPSFVPFVFIELMLWWVVGGSSLSQSTQEQFTWRSTVVPNRKTGIIYGSYSQLYPSLNHGQHSIQLHVQKQICNCSEEYTILYYFLQGNCNGILRCNVVLLKKKSLITASTYR